MEFNTILYTHTCMPKPMCYRLTDRFCNGYIDSVHIDRMHLGKTVHMESNHFRLIFHIIPHPNDLFSIHTNFIDGGFQVASSHSSSSNTLI